MENEISEEQKTILQQIGWRELSMAKFNFSKSESGLAISIQKGKKGIRIEYKPGSDDYEVTQQRVTKTGILLSETLKGIYCDQLQELISNHFKFEFVMEKLVWG